VFSIPYLGYVSNYIQNPPGMYVAIAAGAILIMLVFLPDIFSDDDKEEKKKGK
jgi:signal peptidase